MNIIDGVIILILIIGAIIGFKRGLLPELVSLVSFILTVILAFILKNPLSEFLFTKLPFFKFVGVLKGVTIVNILLYEVIAFVIVRGVLWIVVKVVSYLFKIIEKLLNVTIIYGPVSKICGMVLGIVENYILVFIILYIVSLPFFNINLLRGSKLREPILYKTPVLTGYAKKTAKVGEELWTLEEKYQTAYNANSFNKEALDLFLKYNITTVSSVDKLVELNKIEIDGVEEVLSKYRKA